MSVYWGRPEVAVIGQTDADDPERTLMKPWLCEMQNTEKQ
jgi:hypothetical protein